MAIERRNVRVGSTLRGSLSPVTITLPPSDFNGIVPSQTVPVGSQVSVTGTMMINGGTGNYGAYLRMPTALSIVKSANADKVVLSVTGLDHLGRYVSEILSATNTSCAVESSGFVVWSRIDRIVLTQGSAASMTFSVGVAYGSWALSGGAYITSNTLSNQARSVRRIPIPYACRTASELMGIEFAGWDGAAEQIISKSPVAGSITFSTANDVNADSSTAWDLSAVAVGDIARLGGQFGVLTGGAMGRITAIDDAGDNITVERWVQRGLPVDDLTNTVGNASAGAQIIITRPVVPIISQIGSASSTFVGSMICGQTVVPASQSPTLAGTLPDGTSGPTTLAGHHLQSATFGFQSYITEEPVFAPKFRVLINPENPY